MPTATSSKPWYTSVGIWGSLISGLATITQIITVTLDSALGTHLATNPITMGFVALLGAIMAVIGRWNAIMPIGTPAVPLAVPVPMGPTTTTVTKTIVTTDPPPATTVTVTPAVPVVPATTLQNIS